MQAASTQAKVRKRWFRPRVSLRTFLIVTTLVATMLGICIKRTVDQKRVCDKLREHDIEYELNSASNWLNLLPSSWIWAGGGHWCHGVSLAIVTYYKSSGASGPRSNDSLAESLRLLAELPALSQLQLSVEPSSMSPEELRETLSILGSIHGLKTLTLDWDDVDNVMLRALPPLPKLESLSMGETNATGQFDLAEVKKFPNLQTLSFGTSYVIGNDLSALKALRQLEQLSTDLEITAEEIRFLLGHPTLEKFEFCASCCTDEILKILASFPKLKSVTGSESFITDVGLTYLQGHKCLESLELSSTSITDKGFASLAACPSLTKVVCDNCKLTNGIAPTLVQMTKLESIDLTDTLATTKLLTDLQDSIDVSKISWSMRKAELADLLLLAKNSPKLFESYSLPKNWKEAGHHFGSLPTARFSVASLDLSWIRGLSGRIGQLRDVRSLDTVDLAFTDINDDDLKELSALTQLHSLDITDTRVTANGLAALLNQTSLIELKISLSENLEQAVQSISQLPALEHLVIEDIEEVSQVSFKAMTQLKNLRRLEMVRADIQMPQAVEFLKSMSLTEFRTKGKNWHQHEIQRKTTIPNIEIDLSSTGTTDDELKSLQSLSDDTEILKLNGNPISDDALAYVATLDRLNHLELANTPISDVGLAQILGLSNLQYIDISGTSITEKAWANVERRRPGPTLELKLVGVASIPDILRNLPERKLPWSMILEQADYRLNSYEIEEWREYRKRNALQSIGFSPELAKLWPPEEVLASQQPIRSMFISQTGKVDEILRLASPHLVEYLTIYDEPFVGKDILVFPPSLRAIGLQGCVLTDQVFDAIAMCLWLRQVELKDCDISGCTLEQLQHIPTLARLSIENTPLSNSQRDALDALRPTLIYSRGW